MFMFSITAVLLCVSTTAGQQDQCNGSSFRLGQYNYRIWNDRERSISQAIELAYQEGSKLPVIEGPDMQNQLLGLMQSCNVSKAWLGIQQIAPDRQLMDSGPWSWISDCDDSEAGVISFQGCYGEDNDDRDLPVLSDLSSREVTGERCIEKCREMNQMYAGIQQTTFGEYTCYCGQLYGKYGAATGCSYTCPEGTSHSCGGVGKNSVYHTKNNTLWGSWIGARPTYNNPFHYCAIIDSGGYDNYFLRDRRCSLRFKFMCSVKASGIGSSCIIWDYFANNTSVDDMCYYLSSKKKSWHAAKYTCSLYNSDLVVIKTEAEHNFLKEWLPIVGSSGGIQYNIVWVGAARQTFRRLDTNDTLCYTNFDQQIEAEDTYAYMESEHGSWRAINDSLNTLAYVITQSRTIELEFNTNPTIRTGQADPGQTTTSMGQSSDNGTSESEFSTNPTIRAEQADSGQTTTSMGQSSDNGTSELEFSTNPNIRTGQADSGQTTTSMGQSSDNDLCDENSTQCGNGLCNSSMGVVQCVCNEGWSGDRCDIEDRLLEQEGSDEDSGSQGWLLAFIILIPVFLAAVALVCIIYKRKKFAQRENMSEQNKESRNSALDKNVDIPESVTFNEQEVHGSVVREVTSSQTKSGQSSLSTTDSLVVSYKSPVTSSSPTSTNSKASGTFGKASASPSINPLPDYSSFTSTDSQNSGSTIKPLKESLHTTLRRHNYLDQLLNN